MNSCSRFLGALGCRCPGLVVYGMVPSHACTAGRAARATCVGGVQLLRASWVHVRGRESVCALCWVVRGVGTVGLALGWWRGAGDRLACDVGCRPRTHGGRYRWAEVSGAPGMSVACTTGCYNVKAVC